MKKTLSVILSICIFISLFSFTGCTSKKSKYIQAKQKLGMIDEKGKEVGIQEEERQGKYGRKYYALIHTRESQEMILGELREYLSNLQGE